MCIGASEGASGYAALRRAAAPHGPSPWLGSGPRHIRAERYAKLRRTAPKNIVDFIAADIGSTANADGLYRFPLYTAFGSMDTRPPSAKSDRTSRSIDTDGSPASIFATLD
jgi:hypothetical protein